MMHVCEGHHVNHEIMELGVDENNGMGLTVIGI
jgi:hypothetical protein